MGWERKGAGDRVGNLEKYPTEMLSHSSILAIETHLSSYTVSTRGSPNRTGYTMALHAVYVLTRPALCLLKEILKASYTFFYF
jgi:hypothetical protein